MSVAAAVVVGALRNKTYAGVYNVDLASSSILFKIKNVIFRP